MEEQDCCIGCTTELNALDRHPNGDMPAKCVRCTAEEDHDFDAEPGVRFDRSGRRNGWSFGAAAIRAQGRET